MDVKVHSHYKHHVPAAYIFLCEEITSTHNISAAM